MTEKKKSKVKEEEDEEEVDKEEDKKNSKKKKKGKSKVEEESEESVDDKKKKKKSKVEKEESDDKEDEKKAKRAKSVSKIESTPPSADVEKAGVDPPVDPMKDKERLKILKKCVSHLCLLVLVLAVMNVFLGLAAHLFYDNKTHLVLFGGLSIMQLIGAPIGWVAIKMGNRMLFLVCAIINLIWIIAVGILLGYYWLINSSPSFKQEIALHVGAIFFMTASIMLAICCFLLMNQMDMINITYKKPEVVISAEGKASEKARLKKK